MKTAGILALLLTVASQSALAGPAPRRHARVEHGGALATAALVGEYASSLNNIEKSVLQKLFDGQTDIPYPADKKISIKADAVSCKANYILFTYVCELTFGTNKVNINGRRAYELYATLYEVGVVGLGQTRWYTPEGPMVAVIEALSNLNCTIDPAEVKRKSSSGAECEFDHAL